VGRSGSSAINNFEIAVALGAEVGLTTTEQNTLDPDGKSFLGAKGRVVKGRPWWIEMIEQSEKKITSQTHKRSQSIYHRVVFKNCGKSKLLSWGHPRYSKHLLIDSIHQNHPFPRHEKISGGNPSRSVNYGTKMN
jgi:hypothetical protein